MADRDYTITHPDGREITITGPDTATPDQLRAAAEKAFAGGAGAASTSGIAALGGGLGNGVGKVALGAQELVGKGIQKAGELLTPDQNSLSILVTGNKKRGTIQSAGDWLVNDAATGRAKLDAELAPYKADHPWLANGGQVAGEVIPTLPVGGLLAKGLSYIPGVASAAPGFINAVRTSGMTAGQAAPGALGAVGNALTRAAGGAITGGASTALVDPEHAGTVALIGGATPGLVQLAALAARPVGGFIRGAIEPWLNSGPATIAGRTMARFGIQPQDMAGLTGAPTATGARTTLAEQIARPEGAAGAARLQDAIRSLDPEISARMTAREVENNAARVNALRELAGEGGARDFAAAHRASTAQEQYANAFGVPVKAEDLSPAMRGEVTKLLNLPAVKSAMKDARINAANFGMSLNGEGNIAGLHQAKLAMDDAISKLSSGGPVEVNKAAGIKAARDRLVTFMEKMSPDYQEARATYAQMSQPVNQMDVAGEVLKKGTSSTSDLAGYPRLMPNALTGALKDEPALIKKATGRNLGGSLEQLMAPDQLSTLRSIADEVDRAAAVARAGNGPGSPTAQRLASTNVLQQMGLPEWASQNPILQTVMRPVQYAAQLAEPRIQRALLEITQNPSLAADAMRRATPAQRTQLNRILNGAAQLGYRAAPVAAASQ